MIKALSFRFFLLLSLQAFAWGTKGHKMVANIAKSQLAQRYIDSADHYLQGIAWEDAACWMDNMNQDFNYDFMKPWHYVNIAKDKTYVATKTPDVINELQFVITALQNRKKYPRDEIEMYLKILFHLVGDIHQPLHCGYKDDRGGNDYMVIFNGEHTNLHKVWDSGLIKYKELDESDCERLIKTWPANKISAIQKSGVMDWLAESRALLPYVYTAKKTLEGEYMTESALIIKSQVSKAGLRLAATLQLIFERQSQ